MRKYRIEGLHFRWRHAALFIFIAYHFLLFRVVWEYYWTARFSQMTSSQPSLVVSFGHGRLGNQMSAFASLFAFEQYYGIKSFLFAQQAEVLSAYFQIESLWPRSRILEVHYPNWRTFHWPIPFQQTSSELKSYDYTAKNVWLANRKGQTIDVGPYPNEVALFKHYLSELGAAFKFRPEFSNAADQKLHSVRSHYISTKGLPSTTMPTFVSVHIRRNDYSDHLKALYNKTFVSERYLLKAMDWFRSLYKNVVFVFVSDDLNWAQQTIRNPQGDCYYVGNANVTKLDRDDALKAAKDIGADLALLSHVNHSILTYGTFGMWGALLAGGQVALPASYADTKEMKEIIRANLTGWRLVLDT